MKYNLQEKWPTPFLRHTIRSWTKLQEYIEDGKVVIDGSTLDIPGVVALTLNKSQPSIKESETMRENMRASVRVLDDYLKKGYYVYGVTTGFGGSATTRTTDVLGLQSALMQHTQSAVLTSADKSSDGDFTGSLSSHAMPTAWTRATMLIRCNTNIRGHSAVTNELVDAMIRLLQKGITPVVPLRGSISASGDLMPLSYIAGALQGNPDIFVRVASEEGGRPRVVTAKVALEEANIKPVLLGPKEGLALINGTAASCAVACLALHEIQRLAVLTQLITALNCEALAANTEWAHPFPAAVRPHPGQIEAAQNIRSFLLGSKLTVGLETTKDRFMIGLAQDRYALRSSPQWIGPQLEELAAAERQLAIELNSTTDNPTINVADNDIHSSANFQAAAVTSSTEKTRLACQMLGKLLFAQTSELINSNYNNGLPSNLAADDPSLSFCLKGLDVNMSAYMSELAYLANPVSSHVQSAEMHNQGVNSLALLSARQTMQAAETFSLMVAGAIYAACQGVDLRVLHITFLTSFKPRAREIFESMGEGGTPSADESFELVWTAMCKAWYSAADLDAHERCDYASSTLSTTLARGSTLDRTFTLASIAQTQQTLCTTMLDSYLSFRACFFKSPTTANFLGIGSRRVYQFVRNVLQVPMHQGFVEHPTPGDMDGNMLDGRCKRTIGSLVSIIYEALRDGTVWDDVAGWMAENESIFAGAVDTSIDGTDGNATSA